MITASLRGNAKPATMIQAKIGNRVSGMSKGKGKIVGSNKFSQLIMPVRILIFLIPFDCTRTFSLICSEMLPIWMNRILRGPDESETNHVRDKLRSKVSVSS
jgi:hypothetical protein